MPDMAHMHADLVRAPGIQPELYKGQPAAVKKRLKMRYGRLACRVYGAFNNRMLPAGNRCADRAFYWHAARGDRIVRAPDLTFAHLFI